MGREYTVQEALKLAIEAEKDSMEFYRKARMVTKDERSRRVFDLLATEEMEHLHAFLNEYQGGEAQGVANFLKVPTPRRSPTHVALQKAFTPDIQEQKALEIALQKEKACVELYSMLARDVVDPLVRRIFEAVVRDSQGHYDIIEDEYMRVMRMVDRSDQDTYVRE
ncbi:ferritin family protein [Geomonas sp. RF6]|uniref:ferritin family protein n=1 Tax=Geomonas sp. RF6 TaxID=2897342 RepID=UPI001E62EF74|nr:ferritin family protein [Geomonas sp. RF6]UFS72304.1 ferritin family protein [Geomonas sp. RF6]